MKKIQCLVSVRNPTTRASLGGGGSFGSFPSPNFLPFPFPFYFFVNFICALCIFRSRSWNCSSKLSADLLLHCAPLGSYPNTDLHVLWLRRRKEVCVACTHRRWFGCFCGWTGWIVWSSISAGSQLLCASLVNSQPTCPSTRKLARVACGLHAPSHAPQIY